MKNRYFPYTQKEQNLLMQARNFVDLRVYMHIKEKADFESGRLEHPSALRLTATTIARAISLPAMQGASALEFSRFAVMRSLERLEALGLIDEVDRSGKFLRLRLPMVTANTCESDTEQKKSARKSTENGEQSARKSALSENSETVAAQGIQDAHIGNPAPKSARRSIENGEKSARTKNDESSETVAAQGFSGGNVIPLTMEKQSIIKSLPPVSPRRGEETPPSSTPKTQNHTPSDDGLQAKTEKTEGEVDRLRDVVANAAKEHGGIIKCLKSERSTEVLTGWVGRFKDWEIEDACGTVIAKADVMKPYVDSIDGLMRQQAAKTAKFRRSVCAG